MGDSVFIRVFEDILIEYVPESGKVLSEPFSILVNDNTGVRCFVSTDPSTHNYVNNVIPELSRNTSTTVVNQLVRIDPEYDVFTPFDQNISYVQRTDHPQGFPLDYSELRMYVPTNYTFDDMLGLRLRVYTVDLGGNYVELSNYFIDVTESDRLNEMEYLNPGLYAHETEWGKYLYIRFPSPKRLVEQVRNGVPRAGSLNHILTSGNGMDINCPLFVDIALLENREKVNERVVYKSGGQKSVSFPLSGDRGGVGVVIRPSDQGDFFELFPTYDGSLGGFRTFVRESVARGVRYRVELVLNVIEKNEPVSSTVFLMDNDFLRPVLYRPVVKITTTSVILDVIMRMTDEVTGLTTERLASYVMLQDELTNYSSSLSRLNFTGVRFTDVLHRTDINVPVLGSDVVPPPELKVVPDPFRLFSHRYRMSVSEKDLIYLDSTYVRDRKQTVTLYPFNNVMEFELVTEDNGRVIPLDLSGYSELVMVFKDERREVNANVYTDAGLSGLTEGYVVFKLKEEHYGTVKTMFNSGMTKCRMTGKKDRNREVIMTAEFVCWDSPVTVTSLESEFRTRQELSGMSFEFPLRPGVIGSDTVDNSVDVTDENGLDDNMAIITLSEEGLEGRLDTLWKGVWDSPLEILLRSATRGEKFSLPVDRRKFAFLLSDNGLLVIRVDKATGMFDSMTDDRIDSISDYLKIHDFAPTPENIAFLAGYVDELDRWQSTPKDKVVQGSNRPMETEVISIIRQLIKNNARTE
jgi:hypothetical protein